MAVISGRKSGPPDRLALQKNILRRLAGSGTALGVSELGDEFSKPKMYIYRLLSSLESFGWVAKDPVSQKYKLGDELFNFALIVASQFPLSHIALPYLYELANITNETTALCVRIGYERLYVLEIPGANEKNISVILGERSPLWLGPTGKSMAAFLDDGEIAALVEIMRRGRPIFRGGITFNTDQYYQDLKEIKQDGYVIAAGDYRPDICILAAPIFDHRQRVLGSLVVRGSLTHFDPERARQYSALILEMTHKIHRKM